MTNRRRPFKDAFTQPPTTAGVIVIAVAVVLSLEYTLWWLFLLAAFAVL